MKRSLLVFVFVSVGIFAAGCSDGSADVEPAPKGPAPEIKQAEPGMVPPEQRARESMGAGEGSK